MISGTTLLPALAGFVIPQVSNLAATIEDNATDAKRTRRLGHESLGESRRYKALQKRYKLAVPRRSREKQVPAGSKLRISGHQSKAER